MHLIITDMNGLMAHDNNNYTCMAMAADQQPSWHLTKKIPTNGQSNALLYEL